MGPTLLIMVLSIIAAGGMLVISERVIQRSGQRAQTSPPVRRPRRRDFREYKDLDDDFPFDDEKDFISAYRDEENSGKATDYRKKKHKKNDEAGRITATLIFITLLMLLMALMSSV